MKTVDVIIPVYQPDERMCHLLKRLACQSCPVGRVVLMVTVEDSQLQEQSEGQPGEGGGSSSSLAEWFPKQDWENLDLNIEIHPVAKNDFDHGGTRDLGARSSRAEILLFMTQDAVPCDTRLIENLLQPFADPDVSAVYGRQLPGKRCGEIEGYTRHFNYPAKSAVKSLEQLPQLGIKTYFCSNVCAAYRRSDYLELGGFVKHTIFNEDMIFAREIIHWGKKIAYAADARVFHSHKYTNAMQFRRNFDLAVSHREHPEVFAEVTPEGEGLRLVRETAQYLLKKKKPWLLWDLLVKSGCKYAGYFLGKRYDRLPGKLVAKCTSNPGYF